MLRFLIVLEDHQFLRSASRRRDDIALRVIAVAQRHAFAAGYAYVVVLLEQCRQFRLDRLLDDPTGTALEVIIQAAPRCRFTYVRLLRQLFH